jgi:RNA polymerase primary sigma factor
MSILVPKEGEAGFQYYLRQIIQIPLLTPEQEIKLAHQIRRGDQRARTEMLSANLRLVVKIARDYVNLGLPLLDLISEGNIGLMKAVERFDPTKGSKLSTYASWWIRQSIKRALANQTKTIRLPIHLVEKIGKIRRVSSQMMEELGREPTDEELAEEIGLPLSKISALKCAALRPASLDEPIQDGESFRYGDIVSDEESENPFETLRDKDLFEEIEGMLEVLDHRERIIINMRFGLDGQDPKTLEEIGEDLGVTRERIRQLQNNALARLRGALRRREDSRFDTAAAQRGEFSAVGTSGQNRMQHSANRAY